MLTLSLYLSMLETDEDRDKLEEIYNTYKDFMMKTASELVGQYQAEEDVVHNAIIKIINYLDAIDLSNKVPTKAFIRVVIKCCAIDWLKNKSSQTWDLVSFDDTEIELENDDPLPIEAIIDQENYQTIVDCIHSLGDKYRDVCDLKYVCQLTERQTADILGISVKNVSARTFRAKQILKKKLTEQGYAFTK